MFHSLSPVQQDQYIFKINYNNYLENFLDFGIIVTFQAFLVHKIALYLLANIMHDYKAKVL